MLTVDILDDNKNPIQTSTQLRVITYDSYADGGPFTASIEATDAPEALDALRRWLGYYVIIRNGNGRPVWWGRIVGANTPYGALDIGAALDETYNRVKILYSMQMGGTYVNAETDWVTHVRSSEAFGYKELRHSIGEASPEQAAAAALTVLDKVGRARQQVGPGGSGVATLKCRGLWPLFEWTYYANDVGKLTYEAFATTEQMIGWGVTASDIGFADRAINKLSGELGTLRGDDTIRVTGSTSNNGVVIMEGSASKVAAYTAATISFEAADDILDTAEGLAFAKAGGYINIAGSAANSGNHLLDDVGRDHLAVTGTTIAAEAAGPSITLTMAAQIPVTTDLVNEAPGASVTLAGISRIRYRVQLSTIQDWTAAEIWVKASRVGSPGDSLRLSLYADSGGGLGSLLEAVTIAATNVPTATDWVGASLTNTALLEAGPYIWIVVDRTGSNSMVNYYAVGVDEDQGDPDGVMYLWDGTAWVERAASLPFQLWGASYTSDQIRDILSTQGQFIEGYEVRVSTGVRRRQWRDGSLTAALELTELLEAGTTTGATLLATVDQDWRAIIDLAPASTLPPYKLNRDGTFTTAHGVPLEDGFLPVGQWCEVDGMTGEGDDLAPVSPFLIGYMSYGRAGITDFTPYGQSSVWDISAILQG